MATQRSFAIIQQYAEKCGASEHQEDECNRNAKCIHCEGSHAAGDKVCPYYKYNAEIIALKTKNNISYGQAKILYNTTNPINSRKQTYATVLSNKISKTNDVIDRDLPNNNQNQIKSRKRKITNSPVKADDSSQ